MLIHVGQYFIIIKNRLGGELAAKKKLHGKEENCSLTHS
jgi:hypothetical protein